MESISSKFKMLRIINREDFCQIYIFWSGWVLHGQKSIHTNSCPPLTCSASTSVLGIEQSYGGEFGHTWKAAGKQQSFSPILSAEINSAEGNTWLYSPLTVKLRKLLACQFWKQNAWLMDHVLIQQDTCLYYRNAKYKTV